MLKQVYHNAPGYIYIQNALFNYPACPLLDVGSRVWISSTKNVLYAKMYITDKQRNQGALVSAFFISIVLACGSVRIHDDRTRSHGQAD